MDRSVIFLLALFLVTLDASSGNPTNFNHRDKREIEPRIKADPCDNHACDANAVCTSSQNLEDYTCNCRPGFTGSGKECTTMCHCEVKVGKRTKCSADGTNAEITNKDICMENKCCWKNGKCYQRVPGTPTCTCRSDEFRCNDLGKCLPLASRCDFYPDCADYSDERDCTCPSDRFKCKGSGLCLPTALRCDGTNNCGQADTSDEQDCSVPASSQCAEEEFSCSNGNCVWGDFICDGDDDCGDWSDERGAVGKLDNTFSCANGNCIQSSWQCDGSDDCGDNSDETSCNKKDCSPEEFKCTDGSCILGHYECDSDKDCSDWSNENKCICKDDQIRCKNHGHCISDDKRCNGVDDCGDSSDELDCPCMPGASTCTCRSDEFRCHDLSKCLPLASRCDFYPDCEDFSDERDCTCPSDHFKCKGSGLCLPTALRCDGTYNCGQADTSDEEDCSMPKSSTCTENQFSCENGKCVSLYSTCNRHDDCGDWSDERGAARQLDGVFSCANGKCVKSSWHCDGMDDCGDNSDETSCDDGKPKKPKDCSPEEFKCADGSCILGIKECDSKNDCLDWSDENQCICKDDQIRCKNHRHCISDDHRCDGVDDCGDSSDEHDCPCEPGELRCKNSICISAWKFCNGNLDCADYSDELDCDCSKEQFKCKNPPVCISETKYCDGTSNCLDGSDESADTCKKNELNCAPNQHECDGKCLSGRYVCDSKIHCSDMSDELNCHCPEAKCNNQVCIAKSAICNGKYDCTDGSDEWNCTKPCRKGFHECDNKCINEVLLCDGDVNCADVGDERTCECAQQRTYVSKDKDRPESRTGLNAKATCKSGQCVDINSWCDGKVDCRDKSDEYHGCKKGCPEGYFVCEPGVCIHTKYKCDGVPDCPNKIDEIGCACPPANIQELLNAGSVSDIDPEDLRWKTCDDGLCLPERLFCNGEIDCSDASDERNCKENKVCEDDKFMCTNGDCIPISYTCDGEADCSDASDELDCECTDTESYSKCSNGACLAKEFFCNSENNCGDWSDERDCVCNEDQKQCDNGRCVDDDVLCDRNDDCGDWSDELDCECSPGEFQCSGNRPLCLANDKFCDRHQDCLDGSDEAPNCDKNCPSGYFGCDGRCFSNTKKCDEVKHCKDSSDEAGCSCPHNTFQCNDGKQCVQVHAWCDGIHDCWDSSDESSTCRNTCPKGFAFSSKCQKCISYSDICFGFTRDCGDLRESINCNEVAKIMPCGVSTVNPLFVDGAPAEPHSWPWQVLVQLDGKRACGGTIIDEEWVVSSAHCFSTNDPTRYKVIIGDHDLTHTEDNEQALSVSKINMHPNFDSKRHAYDIALVKLEKKLGYNFHVKPVCLSKTVPDDGADCMLTGWGRLEVSEDETSLNQARMPLVNWYACRQWYAGSNTLTDHNICAGYEDASFYGCEGDIGGPLVCRTADDSAYSLQGVVSWGESHCEFHQSPTVFTKVAQFIDWIKSFTGDLPVFLD